MKKTSTFQNGLIWFGAGVSLAEILTGTAFALSEVYQKANNPKLTEHYLLVAAISDIDRKSVV